MEGVRNSDLAFRQDLHNGKLCVSKLSAIYRLACTEEYETENRVEDCERQSRDVKLAEDTLQRSQHLTCCSQGTKDVLKTSKTFCV